MCCLGSVLWACDLEPELTSEDGQCALGSGPSSGSSSVFIPLVGVGRRDECQGGEPACSPTPGVLRTSALCLETGKKSINYKMSSCIKCFPVYREHFHMVL